MNASGLEVGEHVEEGMREFSACDAHAMSWQ